jgi:hypothetical protein
VNRFQKLASIKRQLARGNARHIAVVRDHQHRDIEFFV